SSVPAHSSGEPPDANQVRVRQVRLLSPCGLGCCYQHQRGGTRLVSLFVVFACSKCVVSGTHRGHRMRERTEPAGIPSLHGGKDVKPGLEALLLSSASAERFEQASSAAGRSCTGNRYPVRALPPHAMY